MTSLAMDSDPPTPIAVLGVGKCARRLRTTTRRRAFILAGGEGRRLATLDIMVNTGAPRRLARTPSWCLGRCPVSTNCSTLRLNLVADDLLACVLAVEGAAPVPEGVGGPCLERPPP